LEEAERQHQGAVTAPRKFQQQRCTMVDVAADTIAIIASKLGSGQSTVQPTDKLTDLGLDSLRVMEMIFDIEERFDIAIPFNANSAEPEFDTVAEVVDAVQRIVDGKV
jgi:acyl carrier protein